MKVHVYQNGCYNLDLNQEELYEAIYIPNIGVISRTIPDQGEEFGRGGEPIFDSRPFVIRQAKENLTLAQKNPKLEKFPRYVGEKELPDEEVEGLIAIFKEQQRLAVLLQEKAKSLVDKCK